MIPFYFQLIFSNNLVISLNRTVTDPIGKTAKTSNPCQVLKKQHRFFVKESFNILRHKIIKLFKHEEDNLLATIIYFFNTIILKCKENILSKSEKLNSIYKKLLMFYDDEEIKTEIYIFFTKFTEFVFEESSHIYSKILIEQQLLVDLCSKCISSDRDDVLSFIDKFEDNIENLNAQFPIINISNAHVANELLGQMDLTMIKLTAIMVMTLKKELVNDVQFINLENNRLRKHVINEITFNITEYIQDLNDGFTNIVLGVQEQIKDFMKKINENGNYTVNNVYYLILGYLYLIYQRLYILVN